MRIYDIKLLILAVLRVPLVLVPLPGSACCRCGLLVSILRLVMATYNIIISLGTVFGNTNSGLVDEPRNFVPDIQHSVNTLLGASALTLENLARPRLATPRTDTRAEEAPSTTGSSRTRVDPPVFPRDSNRNDVEHRPPRAPSPEDPDESHVCPQSNNCRRTSTPLRRDVDQADPHATARIPDRIREKGAKYFTQSAKDWFLGTWRAALDEAKRINKPVSATLHSRRLFEVI